MRGISAFGDRQGRDVIYLHAYDLIELEEALRAEPVAECESCRAPQLGRQGLEDSRRVVIIVLGEVRGDLGVQCFKYRRLGQRVRNWRLLGAEGNDRNGRALAVFDQPAVAILSSNRGRNTQGWDAVRRHRHGSDTYPARTKQKLVSRALGASQFTKKSGAW